MASIVLTAVGNAVLPGLGGALLGALGGFAGGLIDRQLGLAPSRKLIGPRLDNLKVQDSRYGLGIPHFYGRVRVAGQVIWASDLIETVHEENAGGGKGGVGSGVSTVRYSYSAHVAIALGHGPLAALAAVWADGKLIYDGLRWKDGLAASVQFYPGSAAQLPDPVMQAALGAANVPAYRGIAYLVFEHLQLADFGNRLPNLSCEIIANAAAAAPVLAENAVPGLENNGRGYANSGGTPPLLVSGNTRQARQMLVAGMANATAAGSANFIAVTYDVNGEQPEEVARVVSDGFPLNDTLLNMSWSLSPDGRYVAWLAVSISSPAQITLILYDVESRQFGAPLQVTGAVLFRSICWLDGLRLMLADHDGNVLGVRLAARAGRDLADLGFYPVWGVGSASSRFPVGTAHFLPMPGGVLMLTGNAGTSPTALYACHLSWAGGGLNVGASYLLAGSIPAGSLNTPDLLAVGDGEYIFMFRRPDRVVLCSFVPGVGSAVVTRGWQTIMLPVVSNDVGPCWLGQRLVLLQRHVFENWYRISEVTLAAGSFALATSGVVAAGGLVVGGLYYQPFALDENRMLVQGGDPFALDFAELRILVRYGGGDDLAHIAGDILDQVGYAAGDYDVSALAARRLTGYSIQPPMTGRGALEPLRLYGLFDLVESDDKLKAVMRHDGPDLVLPDSELRATLDAAKPPAALQLQRAPELALPEALAVDYLDPAQDFTINTQQARRQASGAQARRKLSLPLACSANVAKRLAEARLYSAWAERDSGKISLSRRYLMLDPGDVVEVAGRLMRLRRMQQAGGLLQAELQANYAPALTSAAQAGLNENMLLPVLPCPASTAVLADLPPLRAEDDQPGFYAALSGPPGWPGGAVWRADDGQEKLVQAIATPAVMGAALTMLAAGQSFYQDRDSSVEIQLLQGTLASCTLTALLQGANAALLGGELIQFQTAVLLGPGHYRLSNLLRGRKGTETAMAGHQAGEGFLLLKGGDLHFIPLLAVERGQAMTFKAPATGQELGAVAAFGFTPQLRSWQPLAPAGLRGRRAAGAGSDLAIGWRRRARLNAEWVDHIDVPLDETVEQYELEIYDGGTLKRSVGGLTAPGYVYSAAQQAADFGVIPASYDVRVYQVSPRYGRGLAAQAAI